jgi:hypothetical protein
LNISTVINIKILTNSNQQTQSYKFTSHIAAFPSVILNTEMLEICIQTSYDQNVQLILKSYLPVVLGTTLIHYVLALYHLPSILKSTLRYLHFKEDNYYRFQFALVQRQPQLIPRDSSLILRCKTTN